MSVAPLHFPVLATRSGLLLGYYRPVVWADKKIESWRDLFVESLPDLRPFRRLDHAFWCKPIGHPKCRGHVISGASRQKIVKEHFKNYPQTKGTMCFPPAEVLTASILLHASDSSRFLHSSPGLELPDQGWVRIQPTILRRTRYTGVLENHLATSIHYQS